MIPWKQRVRSAEGAASPGALRDERRARLRARRLLEDVRDLERDGAARPAPLPAARHPEGAPTASTCGRTPRWTAPRARARPRPPARISVTPALQLHRVVRRGSPRTRPRSPRSPRGPRASSSPVASGRRPSRAFLAPERDAHRHRDVGRSAASRVPTAIASWPARMRGRFSRTGSHGSKDYRSA